MPVIDRDPAVAGTFYPADPDELRAAVRRLLSEADNRAAASSETTASVPTPSSMAGPAQCPKALIAPHAGLAYSGPIAASAFASLRPFADQITRVVLIGPSHRVGFTGIAVPSADRFITPLGAVPVDRRMVEQVLAIPYVIELDEAHEHEHALEIELPFLQEVLGTFSLLPLVVSECSDDDVGHVLDLIWGDEHTLILVSTDLSHFQSYARAREIDEVTSNAILALRPEWIGEGQACGRLPVRGLLQCATAHQLRAELLDLRNSGDTAGPRDRVVGYGAYRFLPTARRAE